MAACRGEGSCRGLLSALTAAAGKNLEEKQLLRPPQLWGASPGAFRCWVPAATLCAADPGSMLGAAETGLISLACGVEGWLMSLAGFQDGSGCRMGTAQAGLVELEDGWWPRSVSPPAPSLWALGQLGALRPQHGLWGRIALEGRVLAPLSYRGNAVRLICCARSHLCSRRVRDGLDLLIFM